MRVVVSLVVQVTLFQFVASVALLNPFPQGLPPLSKSTGKSKVVSEKMCFVLPKCTWGCNKDLLSAAGGLDDSFE